jgi:UDP-N-acetylglucosamine--N-acetylmuramyl-(pentapeptide) pyrophosphoryl-undecaprenol N-acetylglucosamine transferase
MEMLHANERARYHLHAYLHEEMPLALAAADLAIMRSGASVLGELPATRLPAILVPGEYDGGYTQADNARYMQDNDAAVMLRQSDLAELHELAMDLLGDHHRLARMRDTLARLDHPDASQRLATLLAEMAHARTGAAAQ